MPRMRLRARLSTVGRGPGGTPRLVTERVLKEPGSITRGSGFGKGEKVRSFLVTVSSERLKEAVERIKALRRNANKNAPSAFIG